MATKAKASASTSSVSHPGAENPLSEKLAAALDLFHGKKPKEAEAALSALLPQALEAGNFGMIRTIRTTLAALESHHGKAPEAKEDAALAASVHLNRQEAEAALAILDKALKSHATDARLNYLRATALAQLGQAEASAEALGKAIAAQPDLQILFRLEKDFDGVRYGAAFAAYERD